jgi:hypothetical protein
VAVGSIEGVKLQVLTPLATTIDTAAIRSMESKDSEHGQALFAIELADKNSSAPTSLVGRLAEGVLPVRSCGRVWNFPAQHVVAYQASKPPDPPEPNPSKSPASTPPAALPAPAIPGPSGSSVPSVPSVRSVPSTPSAPSTPPIQPVPEPPEEDPFGAPVR